MKQGWSYKRFDEIMKPAKVIKCGQRDDLPVLSITMHGGIVNQNERFDKTIASKDRSNYKVVKNGQLVIAFPIDEGLLYTQDVAPEGIMSPAYNIWDVDYKQIDRRFLVAYFHSTFAFAYYKAKLRGSTQRRRSMDKGDLLSMPIPVPALSIQKEIVAELDLLNGIIEKQKAQLIELDNLSQSIFYEMFGDPVTNDKSWPVKKLEEIASSKIGLTYKPADVSDDGVVVLRSSNIQESEICLDDIVRVGCTIKESQWVKEEDILMCSRNGSFKLVGKVALIQHLPEKMTYGAFMTVIRSEYNRYLFSFFKSPAFRAQLGCAGTATINQITVKMLNEIRIPLPPLALQEVFGAKIKVIDSMKAKVRQSLKESEELYKSRMDYYFN